MATTTAPGRPAPAAEAAAAPPAPESGRKKLVLIAAPLVVLVLAWFFLMGPGSGGEESHGEPIAGEVVPLESITMNLADGRLLKVGLALQLVEGAGGGHGPINGSMALDEAIAFLGEHSYAQLAAPAGRQTAKAELSKRVAERYHDEVMEVYFTEFVMQ